MSVLTAAQSAFIRLSGAKPATLFSASGRMEAEIADLMSEVADDVMRSHDWRGLTALHTLTGDGSTTVFDLPEDYDRMVQGQSMHDPGTRLWGYTSVSDLDEWITVTTGGFLAATPGWWIILDGKVQVSPAPPDGRKAVFPYIRRDFGTTATGVPICRFKRDDDEFFLGDRLLTLGAIWRYRAMKGLEYAEDMANFEKALSEAAARDKGSRVIRHGAPRIGIGRLAYPWPLGG